MIFIVLCAFYLLMPLNIEGCFGDIQHEKFAGYFGVNNEILALREELEVDGLEEDSSFIGGKGVERWIVLPSFHETYLIGIKKRGISLVSISKKVGSLFQAVEKQVDTQDNIMSAVAFSYVRPDNQRPEGVVVVATESPKCEIAWFKILNYKLVHYWSWMRYSCAQSLHHFKVLKHDMLLILDRTTLTACLYSISFDAPTPKIRELEVLPFKKEVVALSVSLKLPEPFLFALHGDGIGIYRYKKFCSDTMYGSFLLQTYLRDMGITKMYPFQSEGREYLAVAGTDAGVIRVDPLGNLRQEIRLENIMEWIIMKTGPNKEMLLLFGKMYNGHIVVLSNAGLDWVQYETPPCYKIDQETQEKTELQFELSCLKNKSWTGVASLEIGDLPTILFADRKYYGEMFHVRTSIKRDILPLHSLPLIKNDYSTNLMRMKSNLEDMMSDIGTSRSAYPSCSIFDMLTTIEKIAADAKETLAESCSLSSNSSRSIRNRFNTALPQKNSQLRDSEHRDHDPLSTVETNINVNSLEIPKVSDGNSGKYEEHFSPNFGIKSHKISPDIEEDNNLPYQDFIDIQGGYSIAGLPKVPDHRI